MHASAIVPCQVAHIPVNAVRRIGIQTLVGGNTASDALNAALLDGADNLVDDVGIALDVVRSQRGVPTAHDEHTSHEGVALYIALQVDAGLELEIATEGLKGSDRGDGLHRGCRDDGLVLEVAGDDLVRVNVDDYYTCRSVAHALAGGIGINGLLLGDSPRCNGNERQ